MIDVSLLTFQCEVHSVLTFAAHHLAVQGIVRFLNRLQALQLARATCTGLSKSAA